MSRPLAAVRRRSAQAVRISREEGGRGLVERLGRAIVTRLPIAEVLPVRLDDLLDVDVDSPPNWRSPAREPGTPLTLNWVMPPPSEGSGGHTTLLRLIEHLEGRGHTCRVYLDDRFDGDMGHHEAELRRVFPEVRAEVADVRLGMSDADVILATSWSTAYAVARDGALGKRAYVVQDFEPWFLSASAEAIFAENTYRVGFHGITAGPWLAEKLAREYGMASDFFEFGCDTATYRVDNPGERNGVVFYAKPSTPRRAYELGVAALTLLHRERPDVEIHLFGEQVPSFPVPHVNHGVVTPARLNEIYNQCAAGLSLSLTNVSLIPWELLASGCVPVVNDARHNRMVLDNPQVAWASATPHGLARALIATVDAGRNGSLARSASDSVQGASWTQAGEAVEVALLALAARADNAPDPLVPESIQSSTLL